MTRTASTNLGSISPSRGARADGLNELTRCGYTLASISPRTTQGRAAILALTLLAITGCNHAPDLGATQTFQAAQETFHGASSSDDYLQAAGLYQQLLNSGIVNGALLYNQGNAYIRAGQRGRAISAYRQAVRFRPRDSKLEANLNYALGPQPLAQSQPILEYVLFWQHWLSYPEKFYLTGLAAAGALALGIGALFVDAPTYLRRLALIASGLTVILACSTGYDWYRFEHLQHGVTIRDDVIARKGNSESYEPAFNQPLHEGTEFRFHERRGNWSLVELPAGQQAWIENDAAVVY